MHVPRRNQAAAIQNFRRPASRALRNHNELSIDPSVLPASGAATLKGVIGRNSCVRNSRIWQWQWQSEFSWTMTQQAKIQTKLAARNFNHAASRWGNKSIFPASPLCNFTNALSNLSKLIRSSNNASRFKPPRLQQCRHLFPRVVHPAPINSLHCRALENHIVPKSSGTLSVGMPSSDALPPARSALNPC